MSLLAFVFRVASLCLFVVAFFVAVVAVVVAALADWVAVWLFNCFVGSLGWLQKMW